MVGERSKHWFMSDLNPNDGSKKTFILDVDDTLMRTQHYYDFSRMNFYKHMIHEFGDSSPCMGTMDQEWMQLYEMIANQNGFSKLEQFPETMVKYYTILSDRLGFKFSQKTANEVYAIGWSAVNPEVYKKNAKFLPGAQETLNFLLEKKDEIIVCTKGDELLQKTKIDALGLRKYSEIFHIVGRKTEKIFRDIASNRNLSSCYSVGDAKRSDIVPAINIGMNAIWIPYDSHTLEQAVSEQQNEKNLFVFKELLDIKRNYDKL